MRLTLHVNGEPHEVEARTDESLLDVLRRELGLLSVRETCFWVHVKRRERVGNRHRCKVRCLAVAGIARGALCSGYVCS